jgi:hypothetical protein
VRQWQKTELHPIIDTLRTMHPSRALLTSIAIAFIAIDSVFASDRPNVVIIMADDMDKDAWSEVT